MKIIFLDIDGVLNTSETNKNLKPVTNYIPILILFFVSTIINYALLSEVYYFKLVLEESNNLIYEQIIITILSISLSLLYCSIFVIFLQRIHENEYLKKTDDNVNIVYFAEVVMTWITYYIVILAIFLEYISELVFLLVFATFIVSRLCPPIYQKIQSKIKVNVRTKKALELGSKVKGMKNYIEDFSNIPNNEVEKIKLYEEYIIYAIILNLKGKLNNDCKKILQYMKKMSVSNKI